MQDIFHDIQQLERKGRKLKDAIKFNNLFYVQNFYVLIRRNLTSRKGHQNTKILIALG